MRNKQLNLAFKPTNYEVICKAYRIAIAKQSGRIPSLNEWARTVLLRRSYNIIPNYTKTLLYQEIKQET